MGQTLSSRGGSSGSCNEVLVGPFGLPALLVFLGLGLALGEAGLGVRFDNAGLAQALGLSALVLILAEGGLTTKWAHARAAAPAAVMLATVGVAVSSLVVAAVTHWLLP